MKWQPICLCLGLALMAAPALAVDAVPFAGFTGLILGSPGETAVDIPANSFVALYALAEYGGLTRVGSMCEVEGPEEALKSLDALRGFVVRVSLVRADGSFEQVARYRMRVREGAGDAARVRELNVGPGDYLLFEFRRKGDVQVQPGQRFYFYAYAGAPDFR